MSTKTRTFRLCSTETGHSFGEWEAPTAREAILQFAEQASTTGAMVDTHTVQAIEITPQSLEVAEREHE